MSTESKGAGASNVQDRDRQSRRAGGNSFEYEVEAHNQPKAMRIGICGAGGAGTDTGKNSTWGAQRVKGGNSAEAPIEKHDQPKNQGKHYVGGKLVGEAPVVDENIQRSERRAGAGNAEYPGHEDRAKGSKRVPASRRFDS